MDHISLVVKVSTDFPARATASFLQGHLLSNLPFCVQTIAYAHFDLWLTRANLHCDQLSDGYTHLFGLEA